MRQRARPRFAKTALQYGRRPNACRLRAILPPSAAARCCRACSLTRATPVWRRFSGAGPISEAFFVVLQVVEFLPPPAGRRRAQRRLRADLAWLAPWRGRRRPRRHLYPQQPVGDRLLQRHHDAGRLRLRAPDHRVDCTGFRRGAWPHGGFVCVERLVLCPLRGHDRGAGCRVECRRQGTRRRRQHRLVQHRHAAWPRLGAQRSRSFAHCDLAHHRHPDSRAQFSSSSPARHGCSTANAGSADFRACAYPIRPMRFFVACCPA